MSMELSSPFPINVVDFMYDYADKEVLVDEGEEKLLLL